MNLLRVSLLSSCCSLALSLHVYIERHADIIRNISLYLMHAQHKQNRLFSPLERSTEPKKRKKEDLFLSQLFLLSFSLSSPFLISFFTPDLVMSFFHLLLLLLTSGSVVGIDGRVEEEVLSLWQLLGVNQRGGEVFRRSFETIGSVDTKGSSRIDWLAVWSRNTLGASIRRDIPPRKKITKRLRSSSSHR